MIDYQKTFTALEAEAICEMIAKLAAECYSVEIWHGLARTHETGLSYIPYIVSIKDTDDSIVSRGEGYYLIDALSDAYRRRNE